MADKTEITLIIEGENHEDAAEALMIQFADGGMDEDIEARLGGQGFPVEDTDFDLEKRTMTIKL